MSCGLSLRQQQKKTFSRCIAAVPKRLAWHITSHHTALCAAVRVHFDLGDGGLVAACSGFSWLARLSMAGLLSLPWRPLWYAGC